MTEHMRMFCSIVMVSILAVGCGIPGENTEPEPKVAVAPTAVPSETTLPTPVRGETQTRSIDGMVMVYVPSGEFVMGSSEEEVDFALQQCKEYGTNCQRRYFSVELPMHSVVLDSFWIDRTEVTIGQYQQCLSAGDCDAPGCQEELPGGSENYPVVCVTWDQAAAYCEWAGSRLPTEAEWEYSARGPERRRYPWGDELEGSYLNYCDTNCKLSKRDDEFDDGYTESAPVGSYPLGASWTGALDMAGNVWEMVADWNGAYSAEKQVNPTGPVSGGRRVARGGSWHTSPDHVRSALRTHIGATDFVNHAGFRCAHSVR